MDQSYQIEGGTPVLGPRSDFYVLISVSIQTDPLWRSPADIHDSHRLLKGLERRHAGSSARSAFCAWRRPLGSVWVSSISNRRTTFRGVGGQSEVASTGEIRL